MLKVTTLSGDDLILSTEDVDLIQKKSGEDTIVFYSTSKKVLVQEDLATIYASIGPLAALLVTYSSDTTTQAILPMHKLKSIEAYPGSKSRILFNHESPIIVEESIATLQSQIVASGGQYVASGALDGGDPTQLELTYNIGGSPIVIDLTALLNAALAGTVRKRAVIEIRDATAFRPISANLGDRYILDEKTPINASYPVGVQPNDIIEYDGSVFVPITPEEGWVAYVDDINMDAVFVDDGTPAWEVRSTPTVTTWRKEAVAFIAAAASTPPFGQPAGTRVILDGIGPITFWSAVGATTANDIMTFDGVSQWTPETPEEGMTVFCTQANRDFIFKGGFWYLRNVDTDTIPVSSLGPLLTYNASWGDDIEVDASLGDVTIVLPASVVSGNIAYRKGATISITRVDNSANTILINTQVGETLNGAASFATLVTQYDSLTVKSNGTADYYWR